MAEPNLKQIGPATTVCAHGCGDINSWDARLEILPPFLKKWLFLSGIERSLAPTKDQVVDYRKLSWEGDGADRARKNPEEKKRIQVTRKSLYD